MTINSSPPIPAAAIEAGVNVSAGTINCTHIDEGECHGCLVEAILRTAAPHMLKEADLELAIEHLHNDVGTLTEQLNRARDALTSIAIHRQEADVPISADSDEADWRFLARRMEDIARVALKTLESPSE